MTKKIISIVIIVLIIAGIAAAFIWNSSNPLKTNRDFIPSGYNDRFVRPATLNFADYINQTQAMVQQARNKAGVFNDPTTIQYNSPFMLMPDAKTCPPGPDGKYENGVVMIHGLGNSPYFMRPIAEHLRSRCYVVYAILLPGHGTVPADLARVNYQDWLAATDYAIDALKQQVHHVSLFGHSIGGLIAIVEGLRRDDIKFIMAFAPALKVHSREFILVPYADWISKIFNRLEWIHHKTIEVSPIEYFTIPLSAMYQTGRLQTYFKNLLKTKQLNIPIFFVTSYLDYVVDPQASMNYFETLFNPKSRLIVFRAYSTNNLLNDPRAIYYKSFDETRHIVSMSHSSLLLPPSDPLHGENGQIKECWYYPVESKDYERCMSENPRPLLGAPVRLTLNLGIVRWLTFNPYYQTTLDQLDAFLQCIDDENRCIIPIPYKYDLSK